MRFSAKTTFLNFFRNIFKIPFLEKFLAKRTKGKATDNFWCKVIPNYYQYKHPSWRNIEREGIAMRVDISDWMGYLYYFSFQNELSNLFELCKENCNAIDVGTNIGWSLLKMGQLSKTGKIIGFEPDRYNFDQCKKNIGLNTITNISVLPYGLGETNFKAQIEVRSKANRGGNRVAINKATENETIEIKKLDEVKEVLDLPSIDLIKIDVEGYELKVLKGAKQLLSRFKPVLFIEVDNTNLSEQGDSAVALVSFLSDLQYFSITNAETGKKVSVDDDFKDCHFDIIAKTK